jgi:hypothetical protein
VALVNEKSQIVLLARPREDLNLESQQASSGVIRRHQASSGVIRRHPASSGVIRRHQRTWIIMFSR